MPSIITEKTLAKPAGSSSEVPSLSAAESLTLVESLPPGTARLNDRRGKHVILSPQPTNDPNDPLNWSKSRKIRQIVLLSLYCILCFSIETISVPLWGDISDDVGFTFNQLNNGYAIGSVGLALGCMIFIPLSLRYGRRPVYLLTSLTMCAVSIWYSEWKTLGDLYVSNLLGGLAGTVNEALFLITVTDLYFVHERGTANGIYVIMVFIGNYFSQVASGYSGASQGWRWPFWWCAIFAGALTIIMFFFLEETKYDVLSSVSHTITGSVEHATCPSSVEETGHTKEQNSQSIRIHDQEDQIQSTRCIEIDKTIPMKTYWQRHSLFSKSADGGGGYWRHFWQPFEVLWLFPIVAFTAIQYGATLCFLTIISLTEADFLYGPPYNFTSIGVGNSNIPPAIGAILGALCASCSDYVIVWLSRRNGGIYEPEMRLYMYIWPGLAMPIGLFMLGFTMSEGKPWIYPFIGSAFVGFGLGGTLDITVTYVQDSYKEILGDALVIIAFIRNVTSMAIGFGVLPWITAMGMWNTYVITGVISVAVSATCIPMIIYGKRIRIRCKANYEKYAALQYTSRTQ